MVIDQATRLREIAHEAQCQEESVTAISKKGHARIFAVTSGKGGVGKTNISVNLAICLAKKGKKVTLVDLDLGLANVDIVLDIATPYTLEHLLRGHKAIEDIVVDGPEGIKIVPGGSGLSNLTDLTERQRELFLDSFYKLALENDYLIFDTAAGISHNVIKFLLAADEIIVVTTDEPTAITDAYALLKVISMQHKENNINFVINMVRSVYEARCTFEKIQAVVKQFLRIDMYNLGYIQYDSCVSDAIKKRKPFLIQYPLSAASKSVKDVAKALLKKCEQYENKRAGFLHKLTQLFSR